MKKLFAFGFAAAFAASALFADISVGVSGRGVARAFDFTGYKNDYDSEAAKADVMANLGRYNIPKFSDDEDADDYFVKDGSHSFPATAFAEFLHDFNLSASTEDNKLGFNLDLEYVVDSNGGIGDVSIPDQAKVWWQPAEWFLGQVGMVQVDDLRGSVGDWGVGRRDIGSLDEDAIFDRFYPAAGVALSFYPVEGLFIGATFDAYKGEDDAGDWAENFYKGINVGFGYTVDEKFQIKAAYFGAKDPKKSDDELGNDDFNGKLEFGFDWNIDETNVLEVGVKLPLWSDSDKRKEAEDDAYLLQVVAGFAGENDNLSYKGHAGYISMNEKDKDGDLGYYPVLALDAGIEVAFDKFTLGATANYGGVFNNLDEKNVNVNTFGAEVYLKKDIAADCFVFAGIADTLVITDVEDTVKNTANRFYVPLGIEYAF